MKKLRIKSYAKDNNGAYVCLQEQSAKEREMLLNNVKIGIGQRILERFGLENDYEVIIKESLSNV